MESTTELTRAADGLPENGDIASWTPAQRALVDAAGLVHRKAGQEPVVAPRSTVEAFLMLCRSTRLNPFIRQIYCIKRGDKWSTEVSIDGARIVAHRTGQFEGYDEISFSIDGGVTWADSFMATDAHPYPTHARVGVWRTGWRKPVVTVARWESFAVYNPVWKNNKKTDEVVLGDQWAKMPDVMLSKVAEMQSLRRAFPNDLSGVYVAEEMMQADKAEAPAREQSKPWEQLMTTAKTKDEVLALFAECRGKTELTDELNAKFARRLDEVGEPSSAPVWSEPEPEQTEWEGEVVPPDESVDPAAPDYVAPEEQR